MGVEVVDSPPVSTPLRSSPLPGIELMSDHRRWGAELFLDSVAQMCNTQYGVCMAYKTIGFRPNAEDQRILDASPDGSSTTIRKALRLLDHERWLAEACAQAFATRDWDPNSEPEAW